MQFIFIIFMNPDGYEVSEKEFLNCCMIVMITSTPGPRTDSGARIGSLGMEIAMEWT